MTCRPFPLSMTESPQRVNPGSTPITRTPTTFCEHLFDGSLAWLTDVSREGHALVGRAIGRLATMQAGSPDVTPAPSIANVAVALTSTRGAVSHDARRVRTRVRHQSRRHPRLVRRRRGGRLPAGGGHLLGAGAR